MKLEKDKIAHVIVGAVITGVLSVFVGQIGALLICAVAAYAKEDYDEAHPERHTQDGWDAYATVCGGIACMGLVQVWQQLPWGR